MGEGQKFYSREISQLMEDVQNSVYMPDKRIFSLLKRLELLNKELNDADLFGFIYHNYARVYSFRENHGKLMQYLHKALYYLLRSDDKELLARSYNLFAIEALKNGCLEIAYEYFSLALSYVEDTQSITKAMIEGNISAIFSQTGDPKKALAYINKSHIIVQKHKKSESYLTLLVMILLNKALISLNLGDIAKTKELLKQLESLDVDNELSLWFLILRCRIAATEENESLTGALIEQICRDLIDRDMFGEIARDLKDLCQYLLDSGKYMALRILIKAIDQNKHRLYFHEAGLFTQIKIQYYSHFQDADNLAVSYEERLFYMRKLEEMEKQLGYESIQLMDLMVELRHDKQKVAEETIRLQKKAETDVLTGLPNRYALNKVLENAFSRALEKGTIFGVGMADINSFKRYNDTYGHGQGDLCLQRVGTTLKTIAQKHGIFVCRYGGDEFTFVYEDMDPKKIRSIEKEFLRCGDVTISHGFYCAVPDEDSRIWDYLNQADALLYASKKKRG